MPISTGRVTRTPPYGRSGSRTRRPSFLQMAHRPDESQVQYTNRVEHQLLRALVQSLPSDNLRSRAPSCPPTFRRRRLRSPEHALYLGAQPKTKIKVKLPVGLPVNPVSCMDPPVMAIRTAGVSENVYAQHAVGTAIRRREQSPAHMAKAREEEYEKVPPVKGVRISLNDDKDDKDDKAKQMECPKRKCPQRSRTHSRGPSLTGSRRSSGGKMKKEPENTTPVEVAKEAKESDAQGGNNKALRVVKADCPCGSKIIPCFRGEYPSHNRSNARQWFKAAGPTSGNLLNISNKEKGGTMTALEVTEAHFLSIKSSEDRPLNVNQKLPPCKQRNSLVLYEYPQQQHQQYPCMQQQPPCMQLQQSNCLSNPPCSQNQFPRSCCGQNQDQYNNQFICNQQTMQQQQLQYPKQHCNTEGGLTETLAQELKQQMQSAQAQIAQVQLQLNNACGGNLWGKKQVPVQNETDDPSTSKSHQSPCPRQNDDLEGDDEGESCTGGETSCYSESIQEELPCNCQGRSGGGGFLPTKVQQSCMSFPCSQQQPMQFGLQGSMFQCPNEQQHMIMPPCLHQQQHMPPHMSPCMMQQQQQNISPCQQQQNISPCQQQQNISPCQQQQEIKSSPCQQQQQNNMSPCQQQQQNNMSPCQQQQQRSMSPCQQRKCPCQQQQEPPCCSTCPGPQSSKRSSSKKQKRCSQKSPPAPNMCHFCPNYYWQGYPQMRFMMPRCWPG
ncbi:hypothetical protein KR009_011139 [Drosophila setifemur]|nr:hypothetical protein KR009_011139 [Drosophila setifemur]